MPRLGKLDCTVMITRPWPVLGGAVLDLRIDRSLEVGFSLQLRAACEQALVAGHRWPLGGGTGGRGGA